LGGIAGWGFINVKFHPHLECDRFLKAQFFTFTLKMGKNNDMTSTDGMLTYNKKKIIKFIRSMPILNAIAHHPQSLSCNLLHHRHRQNPDEQKRIKMFLLARTDIIN
jgi:hypothetical protein